MAKSFLFDKDELIMQLRIARMDVYYKDFVRNCLKIAIMMDVMFNTMLFFILSKMAESSKNYAILLLLIVTIPFGMMIVFKFFLKMPQVKILRSKKNIDAEIVSAIRFLVLDLKANAPIFDALQNLSNNYGEIGKYLKDVIVRVKLGSSLEASLNEAVEMVPSENFRVLLWQILNHMQTGTDITHSLGIIADEIVEKQKIDFKKYGKKLNVISLFYMIVAIILPTIGFTMIAAGLIFLGFAINAWVILLFWGVFSLLQVVFLAMSSGNRPVVES